MPRKPPAAPEIIGHSPALRSAVDRARKFARLRVPVVIHGESGTGKELFAALIHTESGRSGAFVPVNCGALPESIAESTLFGHKRGAFTNATTDERGLVEASSGGTLFLDEIGELSLSNQVKLLRVLQQARVMRLGESQERAVDLRVVCASHRDLRALVASGAFREDLYHRLAAAVIEVPPLRSRGRDVLLLARRGLALAVAAGAAPKRLAGEAEDALVAHAWPGNVRELNNVMLRLAVEARGRTIAVDDVRRVLGPTVAREVVAPEVRVAAMVAEGPVTAAAISEATGLTRPMVKRLLARLAADGAIVASGTGRGAAYRAPVAESGPLAVVAEEVADPRVRWVRELAARDGVVTRSAYAALAGVATRTAGRALADLVEAGWLAPNGRSGPASGYVLRDWGERAHGILV